MIVVDLQAVQSVGHGERGIARYTRELAKALAAHHPDVVDVYAYDERLPNAERLDALGLGDKIRSFRELRGSHVDVLHVNSPFERSSIADLAVPVRAATTVVTCYDLIPHRFSDRYLPTAAARAWYQSRLLMLHAADAIVTDSESAAADAVHMLGIDPARVTSIGAGTSPDFTPPTTPVSERIGALRLVVPTLLPGFVLVPAGAEWRKNIAGAVDAYSRLPELLRRRHQLVIASKLEGSHLDDLVERCTRLGVVDDVVVTGYVDDADLVRFYQSAELVLFPSFYEGFGLPVLEARRCGARVLCSNSSSLPEVLPEPAALFNPHDVDDIAAHLHAALVDHDTKSALDRAPDPGFTWRNSADRLVEVYAGLTAEVTQRLTARADRRPVVAVVARLDQHLDNGTVNAFEVMRHLRRFADVRAFVVDHGAAIESARIWSDFHVEVSNIRTLPTWSASGDVDHVVYCTGDDATDRAAAAVASVVPGLVLEGVVPRIADLVDELDADLRAFSAAQVVELSIGVVQSVDEAVAAMRLTPATRLEVS